MAWFEDWFGTRYYKLLYRNRSEAEAHIFLDRLMDFLALPKGAKILDRGGGRGRHSIYLASKGYDVTGIDIVPLNINYANRFESSNLHFFEHDMRKRLPGGPYDAIINLFTSFGYFETEEEDIRTLQNASNALNDKGVFVLDFLNAHEIKQTLVPHSHFKSEDVEFMIDKTIENGFIIKNINVTDQGKNFHYKEKVKLLSPEDFENYFNKTSLKTREKFGDYHLTWFDPMASERMILIANKTNVA